MKFAVTISADPICSFPNKACCPIGVAASPTACHHVNISNKAGLLLMSPFQGLLWFMSLLLSLFLGCWWSSEPSGSWTSCPVFCSGGEGTPPETLKCLTPTPYSYRRLELNPGTFAPRPNSRPLNYSGTSCHYYYHTCHILPPSEIDLGLFLPTWKGNIYFTELAERVEYGKYDLLGNRRDNCSTSYY